MSSSRSKLLLAKFTLDPITKTGQSSENGAHNPQFDNPRHDYTSGNGRYLKIFTLTSFIIVKAMNFVGALKRTTSFQGITTIDHNNNNNNINNNNNNNKTSKPGNGLLRFALDGAESFRPTLWSSGFLNA